MISIPRLLKDYRQSGALHTLIGIDAAVAPGIFLTKSGNFVGFLQARGQDFECLDPDQLNHGARRFESILRGFDERFLIRQYVVKRKNPALPTGDSLNPVVAEAAANRRAYLSAKDLSSFETYFAVEMEGGNRFLRNRSNNHSPNRLFDKSTRHLAPPTDFLSGEVLRRQADALKQGAEILRAKMQSLVLQASDFLDLVLLDNQAAFTFQRKLVNLAPHKAESVRLKYNNHVDYQTCSSELECHREALRLDDYHIQVLTLKEPPSRTTANMLRTLLDIPSEFVISSDWQRQHPSRVRQLIRSKRRHFHNSKASLSNYLSSSSPASKDMLIDDGAVAVVHRLGECLEEMENHGLAFGQFSLSLVLFDTDPAALQRSVAQAFKAFAAQDAQLTEERYNRLNAFLAVLPGNSPYNVRRLWLSETNYADLSFLYTVHSGNDRNDHLNAESLAIFERNTTVPYLFNLHYKDVAHTLILGSTGSGKSFLLNFLLLSLQKYGGFSTIFDLGGSYQKLAETLGGSYLPIGRENRSATINPFCLPLNKDNLAFLFSFTKVLIESNGYRMTAEGDRDLYEQIENLYSLAQAQRRLSTLANIVHRDLRGPLQKWVAGGPYGSYFDHSQDTLTFARFQVVDFEGLEKAEGVLEALLFYLFHRTSAAITDPANGNLFKTFAFDEAWRFFRHPAIKAYIVEALKTWRKKNAAIILATQSTGDLLTSDLLATVVESCPTQLFLANPRMDQAAYRQAFHLSETEAGLVATLTPKQQILVKQPDGSRVVNLNVDQATFDLCSHDPRRANQEHEPIPTSGGPA